MQKSMKRYFPIFVLPTLIAFIIAFLYPFIIGIYLSFTEFTTVRDAAWVGINNYKKIFRPELYKCPVIYREVYHSIRCYNQCAWVFDGLCPDKRNQGDKSVQNRFLHA